MGSQSNQIQLIDEKQDFNSTIDLITHWGLQDRGFDYHVVAVFGSQSTGKSTLLNLLFGTTFDVMNMSQGRSQTTKGIWMSRASEPSILVMDVEGTDGRERGEDQDFERKSALFSLATAEVVLINMWENSVGLYNGANMSLLRTVMEVNLQLFQKNSTSKTCLLFVLRDSTGVAPLESLADTLKSDLEKIWSGLSKPVGKETALISDYFDFAFATAAHKIYAAKQFEEDVMKIQRRFYDKSDPDYILKTKYHKGIPADGFPHFAKTIWNKILDNRDLDLPTQQQLLAQYRCDEIAKAAFDVLVESIKPLKAELDTGDVLVLFGKSINDAYQVALTTFDKDASRYHSETYNSKKREFKEKIHSHLLMYYLQLLRNLKSKNDNLFQLKFTEALKGGDVDFGTKFNECKDFVLQEFINFAQNSRLVDSDWSYDEYLTALREEIEEFGSQKRTEALHRVSKTLERSVVQKIEEPVKVLISGASPDLWQEVNNVFKSVSDEIGTVLETKLTNLGVNRQDLVDAIKTTKFQAWETLLKTLLNEVSDGPLLEKLRRKFESVFRYDEKGLPRVWKPTDDIDTLYSESKHQADEYLLLLSKFDIPVETLDSEITSNENFDPASLQLIPGSKLQLIKERFGRESDSLFIEAKRATVASKPVIPPWFIVLTIALGWNEFMSILRNPMLTLFFLTALSVSYFIWKTNMSGPVLQIARATASELGNQAKVVLKDKGLDIDEYLDIEKMKTKVTNALNQVHHPQRAEQIEMRPMKETE